ncbi:MAG: hypothetical protein COA79_02000 [Planctomycetota bacterium]|nr:MAG: hypothetical protein COA79_02000 [Planctomycetota bacterium]
MWNKTIVKQLKETATPYPQLTPSSTIKNYLEHYDLPQNEGFSCGYKSYCDFDIFVQFYQGEKKEVIFLSHGYCDHGALFKHVLKELLSLGYSVAIWDYAGFGLSSGKSTAIDEFKTYGLILQELIKDFVPDDNTYSLIGHSAGCMCIINGLQVGLPKHLNKIIFMAPLIRACRWFWIQFGCKTFGAFTPVVPRKFRPVSGDIEFLDFIKNNDPLEPHWLHVSWPKALLKWEKGLKDFNCDKSLLVLQGLSDDTVSATHNLPWFKDHFSNYKEHTYPIGRHHLHNEIPEIKIDCIQRIADFLK